MHVNLVWIVTIITFNYLTWCVVVEWNFGDTSQDFVIVSPIPVGDRELY